MQEGDIERRLRDRLRQIGCRALKFESPGYTGVPDRIVLIPGGRVVFVELKAPGKRERPRQVLVQREFRRYGLTVFSTVDSYEKVDEVVSYCREAMNNGV